VWAIHNATSVTSPQNFTLIATEVLKLSKESLTLMFSIGNQTFHVAETCSLLQQDQEMSTRICPHLQRSDKNNNMFGTDKIYI